MAYLNCHLVESHVGEAEKTPDCVLFQGCHFLLGKFGQRIDLGIIPEGFKKSSNVLIIKHVKKYVCTRVVTRICIRWANFT